MKTSQQWWDEVKKDEVKLVDWLKKQYHGEYTAWDRITAIANKYTEPDSVERGLLLYIAGQEHQHANWIRQLLIDRGKDAALLVNKPERYWDKVLPAIESLETATAVAAHAEGMRLERIKVIAFDQTAPEDIRDTFFCILPEEMGHEAIFRSLAKDKMGIVAENHAKGLEALGLIV